MGKHLNFVHNDEIWKDHVHREMHSAAHKWPQKWHFLIEEYKNMYRELEGYPATPDRGCSSTPSSLSIRISPLGSGHSVKEVKPKRHSPEALAKGLKLPQIKGTSHAQPAFPITTASLIGWKSTKPENNLEIYRSSKARGRIGIQKIFNWPQQSL